MTMGVERILVALELEALDRPVLEVAKAYAQAFGAEVFLIHVVPPEPDFVGLPKHGEAARPQPPDAPKVGYAYDRGRAAGRAKEKHAELEAVRAELEAANVEATALLIEGTIPAKILEEAERLDAQIVILGSHQRSAVGEWLLGSTSHEVVRRAPCPVLVVPRPAAGT